MPAFAVRTASQTYQARVERGCLATLATHIPARAGKVFVVSTADVWALHGPTVERALEGRKWALLNFPGGEENKKMAQVESWAEQMVELGGDRSSLVVGFGGGIVTDLAGFLAAVFMRGVPVIQIPTTLLSQVDAGVGGKTGANLQAGKNLVGAFHQPLVVLTDPLVLSTLPEREYRAGLYEVIKHGVIRSAPLFELMRTRPEAVLAREAEVVEEMLAESVRIKCEVVSADEKEGGLRKILNFGHTIGHAIEAETKYTRYLHGEAVALGMKAAAHLSRITGRLTPADCEAICQVTDLYGPVPSMEGLTPEKLMPRLVKDKKAVQGTVHFVLATGIGSTEVVAGLPAEAVRGALEALLG